MRKIFCDGCEQEITEKNQCKVEIRDEYITPLGGLGGAFRTAVGTSLCFYVDTFTPIPKLPKGAPLPPPSPIKHDWCKYCLIAAVESLDDRPQIAPLTEVHVLMREISDQTGTSEPIGVYVNEAVAKGVGSRNKHRTYVKSFSLDEQPAPNKR